MNIVRSKSGRCEEGVGANRATPDAASSPSAANANAETVVGIVGFMETFV